MDLFFVNEVMKVLSDTLQSLQVNRAEGAEVSEQFLVIEFKLLCNLLP